MQSTRTGVGAFNRATSEGPSRAYRGQSGFLGSSTRQGHYGFFGSNAGTGPSPGFFNPFTGPSRIIIHLSLTLWLTGTVVSDGAVLPRRVRLCGSNCSGVRHVFCLTLQSTVSER